MIFAGDCQPHRGFAAVIGDDKISPAALVLRGLLVIICRNYRSVYKCTVG